MKIDAQGLYDKLVDEYGLIGHKGEITFTLKDFSIKVESRDSVGNLIQEWLKEWMKAQGISFEISPHTQAFPDILLDVANNKNGLLEVKSFDVERGPGFDLANFDAYCNSLKTHAYRLYSDYLIIAYKMEGNEITIANIWLKKIWEISGASSTYPIKVQEKKGVIYNLRPIIWYSTRSTFKPFESKEAFLVALNEARYQYPKTRQENAHWLNTVKKNYAEHTGISLNI